MKRTKLERMLSILLIFSLISTGFLGIFLAFGTDNVTAARDVWKNGHIIADETWTWDNSPYYIDGDLWIDPGVTLTIQAGVWVGFLSNYNFIVDGNLQINGLKGNETIIYAEMPARWTGYWNKIELKSDNNVIEYCNISSGDTGLFLNGSNYNQIKHCDFQYHNIGILLNNSNNNIIENCTLHDCDYYGTKLNSSHYNKYINNTIEYNWEGGALLDSSDNNVFSNIFYNSNGQGGRSPTGRSTPRFSIWAGMIFSTSKFNFIDTTNFTGNEYGIMFSAGSSNNIMESCEFYVNNQDEICLLNSQDVFLVNSSIIDSDIGDNHITLDSASHIFVVNSIFNESLVMMFDPVSKLTLQWFLNVNIMRLSPSVPIPDANVVIKDKTGTEILNTTTNSNGDIKFIRCTDREQIGMAVNNTLTPHNVSAAKAGFFKGYATPGPMMTTNRNINLKLVKIPVDYIVVRDGPDGSGAQVDNRLYFKSNKTIFYAACYNNTLGFIADLPASWESSNTSVANITPPVPLAPAAEFEAIENGTVIITAMHESVAGQTGTITVEMWNLVPGIAGLPDQVLNEDQSLDNAIDLWAYAEDNETLDTDLAFTVTNLTSPECGLNIDSNRYIDIDPTENWFGSSNVTIEVFDGYNGYANDTFTVTVDPVNDAPALLNGDIVPIFGDILTLFNYTVTYLDIDNDAAEYVRVSIDGINQTMKQSSPSDIITEDGKEFHFITTIGPGTDHTYQFHASDGVAHTSTGIITNPTVVAPDLYVTNSDIILSVDSTTIVNSTNLTINATIHNGGESEVVNVHVNFEIKIRTRAYVNWTALGPEIIITHMLPNSSRNVTLNWLATPPGSYTIRITIDPRNDIPEIDENNNSAVRDIDIGPDKGLIDSFEVKPSSWTMTEGESKQFNAVGYDWYGNPVPITVTWYVNGGGTIDSTGNFKAELWGTWEISADYLGTSVTVNVVVKPLPVELSKITIIPYKWIMIINDTKQFTAHAYDLNGSEVVLNLEWELKTGGGTIDRNGLFEANEAGKWVINAKYQALNAEVVGNTSVVVLSSKNESITENFKDPDSEIDVTADISGSGTIDVSKIAKPPLGIPEDLNDIGIFIEITKSDTLNLNWAVIKIPFESLDLPADVDPSSIKIYYWTGTEWLAVEDSWVDGDFIYANVTHFTIFAPMAESAQKESGEDKTDNTLLYAVAAIIVIIIIVVIIGVLVRKKGPSEKEQLEAEVEKDEGELEDEEQDDLDALELEPEFKKCKKCGEELEVPKSEDEKVSLKCTECGARGRIPNPYLEQLEALRAVREEELMQQDALLEELDDWDAGEEEPDEDDEDAEWADNEEDEEESGDEDEPLDDWDAVDVEQDEKAAVKEFEAEKELDDDEELDDWDAEKKDEEDGLEDWD